jgi:hypothetical protein
MKKENLIAQLEGAKALSSQVDIDKVIELLGQLEPEVVVETKFAITQELADELQYQIRNCLDYNSDGLVDLDSAELELEWSNQIRLSRVDVNVDDIVDHITSIIETYVAEEEAEEEADEEGILTDINQGLGLEPGGNPYSDIIIDVTE